MIKMKMQILAPALAAAGERWSVTCIIAAHEDAPHHLGIVRMVSCVFFCFFFPFPPPLSSTHYQVLKALAGAGVRTLAEKGELQHVVTAQSARP